MSPDQRDLWIRDLARVLVTLMMVAVAAAGLYGVWQGSRDHPWTRDGQVLADTAHVAARVAGQVTRVYVADNAPVARGDPLFDLDPVPFQQAIEQAAADLALRRAEAAEAEEDARDALERQARGEIDVRGRDLKAALARSRSAAADAAEVALATARLQLADTRVVAPVDGFVTNLRLRPGSSVAAGVPQIAVLDRDSFWVAAYFKETDLPRIQVGDGARVTLIGYPDRPLSGRVESIAHGIERRNDSVAPGDLARVEPMFEWIRLAQRIPVRIRLDDPPSDLVLRVGYTASVAVNPRIPVVAPARTAPAD